MDQNFVFAIIASIFGVLCFIPYIIDIFLGKTKPHMYSWFIWSLLQTVGVLSMLSSGAGIGTLSLAIGAFLCFFIFILSFKYGTKNIKNFDIICFLGSVLAIIFYLFIKNPLYSIIIISITDFLGFLPTMRKAYEEPKTETISTYILASISSIFAISAMESINMSTVIYSASLVLTNGICGLIIFIKRKT